MNLLNLFSLKGKVSLVTGGERGIGFALATGFAQAGSDIILAGMDMDSMPAAQQSIEALGVQCMALKTDVTDESQVNRMVEAALERFGRIDVLLNNAGSGKGSPAEEMDEQDFRRVIEINLTSQFLVSKAVGNVMLRQGKGSIVNIASMSGSIVNNPQPQCNYNSSKAGVIMLTKSLACEWAKRGVRVNCISPGYMKTQMTKKHLQPGSPKYETWMTFTPMGRMGLPEELAGAALYLASDASSYTTGANLAVDGGYTCY